MEDWIKWAIGLLLLGPMGWLWKRIVNLETSHSNHKDHVSNSYMRKDDAQREFGRLEARMDSMQTDVKASFAALETKLENHFQRIYDKLDSKADK